MILSLEDQNVLLNELIGYSLELGVAWNEMD